LVARIAVHLNASAAVDERQAVPPALHPAPSQLIIQLVIHLVAQLTIQFDVLISLLYYWWS